MRSPEELSHKGSGEMALGGGQLMEGLHDAHRQGSRHSVHKCYASSVKTHQLYKAQAERESKSTKSMNK